MIKDTASRESAVPREGDNGGSPRTPASLASSAVSPPFPREVLIDAARLKARGAEWEPIAEKTGADVGELVTFSIDHPEVWGPLYERAEKLRLQEAEGETIKGLCMLLKGDSEEASESAAKELLIHRRHVERRRGGGRLPERGLVPPTGGDSLAETTPGGRNLTICQGGFPPGAAPQAPEGRESASSELRQEGGTPPVRHGCRKTSFGDGAHNLERWLTEDPPPEEIVRRITYAANRVAHGDDYHRIARETGQAEVDVTRWAFIYAKAWDKAYPTARRAAAQAGASLAINRLLTFVVGPDLKQAARAGRTLLVHRRHMHWGAEPRRESTDYTDYTDYTDEREGRENNDGVVSAASAASTRASQRRANQSVPSVKSVDSVLPRSRDGPG